MTFGRALSDLTVDDIRLLAHDLADVRASTVDQVAATRAVLVIEQTLRHTHRVHNAAAAALAAASTVQEAAQRAHVPLPDSDVTRVARAAAQLARGFVAIDCPGVEDALRCLSKGWHHFPGCAELVSA